MQRLLERVPWALIGFRAVCGPLMLVAAYAGCPGTVAVLLSTAFVSDIFDGVIARKLNVVTERLRWTDSRVDTVLLLCAAVSTAWVRPEAVRPFVVPFLVLAVLHVLSMVFDIVKFGRLCSLHAYSSKAALVAMVIAGLALLLLNYGGIIMWLALGAAYLNIAEGFAMKFYLRDADYDVAGIVEVLRKRRNG